MINVNKKLHKKKKGFALTLETMAAALFFSFFIAMCTFTLVGMERQKFMFNALVSGVSQAARWGGTNTTMYQTYSKSGMNIEEVMRQEIYRVTGQWVNLSITPENVQAAHDETIRGSITWKDVGTDWFGIHYAGKTHGLDLETESIVTRGLLIDQ